MPEKPLKNKRRNKGWDNLKPCKPGETHNPNGRPKLGTALTDVMREYLSETITDEHGNPIKDKRTRAQAFVRAVYARAMKGGDAAQRLIMNYIDGMPETKGKLELINAPEYKAAQIIINGKSADKD